MRYIIALLLSIMNFSPAQATGYVLFVQGVVDRSSNSKYIFYTPREPYVNVTEFPDTFSIKMFFNNYYESGSNYYADNLYKVEINGYGVNEVWDQFNSGATGSMSKTYSLGAYMDILEYNFRVQRGSDNWYVESSGFSYYDEFSFYNFGTIFAANADNPLDGSLSYLNNLYFAGGWQIPSVPEPTTWALMILGFGLIAATMRRQRAQGRDLAFA